MEFRAWVYEIPCLEFYRSYVGETSGCLNNEFTRTQKIFKKQT